jgi:hypothetical protein
MNTAKYEKILPCCAFICARSTMVAADAEEVGKYIGNFEARDLNWSLVIPAPVESGAYADAQTAIWIESVVCDGKILEPNMKLRAGGANPRKINVTGATVLYQFGHSFLDCWKDVHAVHAQVAEIRSFDLPKGAKRVDVRYRVRWPDERLSKPLVITYFASDELISVASVP